MTGATERPVIVAAAGPGVSLAVAKRFARDGHSVALIARRQDALDCMAAEIAGAGGTARGFAADVTDMGALRDVLAGIVAEMGAPAALVWNGGRWVETPALALDTVALETDLPLTTVGAVVAAQAVAPAMEGSGGGSILVTGGGWLLRRSMAVPCRRSRRARPPCARSSMPPRPSSPPAASTSAP